MNGMDSDFCRYQNYKIDKDRGNDSNSILMKEYVLPITFRTINDEIESLVMNLYLPIPAAYNRATLTERYEMYAIFLMVNIHNLTKWLNCKPKETYIAKITNINTESIMRSDRGELYSPTVRAISCDEMITIVRRTNPAYAHSVSSTYIIIFSGDSIMNTASLDVYPLKFNIYISLGLSGYITRHNRIAYPIYIKNLLINNPEVERYVMEFCASITSILCTIYGPDIISKIHTYYDWDFCSRHCKFLW
jgi:hypothetical protein